MALAKLRPVFPAGNRGHKKSELKELIQPIIKTMQILSVFGKRSPNNEADPLYNVNSLSSKVFTLNEFKLLKKLNVFNRF